jgi:hypothetical protein
MLARRARARAESRAVAAGVEETVALSAARGAGIEAPAPARGGRDRPYRKLPGLEWLARRGRIAAAQKSAGERYGACYRRARAEPSIGSTLDVQPEGGGGTAISAVLAQAEARVQAAARLEELRRRLGSQPALVAACDLICGQELTPREAAGGDREAGRLEAVLEVALDLLAEAG